MTDAPLSIITSKDGRSWSKSLNLVNGYSDYGLQMANYRGEIYGIMTQTKQYPKQLFATKFVLNEGWRSFKSLPSKYRALGRVAVTTLEDRFYVAYRGTNDGVYLIWTEDFEEWNDAGRIGSQYAKSVAAPAISAYDGKLYLTGVGPDKYIYFTTADVNGKRLASWKKIDGTGTRNALCSAVFDGKLWLFHAGYNGDKIFYQYLTSDGWSQLEFNYNPIRSGLSAVAWKYNKLVVSYRANADGPIVVGTFNGVVWTDKRTIPNEAMKYQTGLTTWGGQLVLSFADKNAGSSSSAYKAPMFMDEKAFLTRADETEGEWDCKWDSNKGKQQDQQKSWVKSMFCL